jgi:hypothetical protein
MATIERTAYPRFPKAFSTQELKALYAPLPEELDWVRRSARGERSRLGLLVLLKVFQQLHYFPALDSIPAAVVDYVRATAGIDAAIGLAYETRSSVTLFRHHAAIRDYLGIKPYYGTDASEIAIRAAHAAAATLDQPVDIINATIDELIVQHLELPAFSTLDRIAEQIHAKTQTSLFRRVARRLTSEQKRGLDALIEREFANRKTTYNAIKRHAKRPSRQHLDRLIDHLAWLETMGDFTTALSGIPVSKRRSLALQAISLDAANLRGGFKKT